MLPRFQSCFPYMKSWWEGNTQKPTFIAVPLSASHIFLCTMKVCVCEEEQEGREVGKQGDVLPVP